MTEATRETADKLPNATVGSDEYLHITTPFPAIGVPDAGCHITRYQKHLKVKQSRQRINTIFCSESKLNSISVYPKNLMPFTHLKDLLKATCPSTSFVHHKIPSV